MKKFSEILKHERISNGWTQQDFADKLGIPRSTYKNYETADEKYNRQPPIEIIREMAILLEVSVDYLFDLKDL